MIAGISSSVIGASVQSMRMDVLASNLSDASCVGYKPRAVILAEAMVRYSTLQAILEASLMTTGTLERMSLADFMG